jgi:ATP-dependent exoDNAse (exonuclease V) beta subunit
MIQASAGSGKTHDLVGRYLRLLDRFEKPQAIVALTFTRKAAAEFFDRILSALAEAAESADGAKKAAEEYQVLSLSKARALQLLRLVADHLHELSLGTLDGFYARVLRAFPAEFGVTADYEVLDEVAAKAARREVLDGVLETARGEAAEAFLEAFKRATFGSEERGVTRALEDYVKKYHAVYLGAPGENAWGEVSTIWPQGTWWLTAPQTKEVEKAMRALDAAADEFLAEEKPKKNPAKALQSVIKMVAATQPGVVGDPATFVVSVLQALDGLRGGSIDELIYSRSKIPLTSEARNALVTAGHWVLWCDIVARMRQTGGVREIVKLYEQRYDLNVRRTGKLGFDDVLAVLAGVAPIRDVAENDAGGTDPRRHFLLSMDRDPAVGEKSVEDREALRLLVDYRLDAKFQHWLIDEFQDTSRRQWQVLVNLIDEVMFDDSGERSFYYVGDIKQAIFGWRGGDSRLFEEVRRRYRELPEDRRVQRETLDDSWRSGPVILEMVNRVFGNAAALAEVLGDDHREVIENRWAETWGDHRSNVADQPGYARWVTVPKPAGERSLPDELRWKVVLETLRELRLSESKLKCVVLVRKGKSAHELADYVRQHSDIPVVVEGRMAVGADHPVGTSFAALLRWAAHPGDTRCREHIRMTPPHTRLSVEEAIRWEAETPALVLRLVHDFGFGEVFERWAELLHQAVEEMNRGEGIGDFSKHRMNQVAEACRHFDDSGRRDIDEFLDFLEGYEAADLPAPGTVQLMTVHKAKGLTFDAVIVADIEGDSITSAGKLDALRKSDEEGDAEWVLMRPKKDIALAVEPLAGVYRQAEMDAGFEELCVLYVALTRARYANFVVSSQPSSTKGNCAPPKILDVTLSEGEPEIVDVDGLEVQVRYENGDPDWLNKARPKTEEKSEPPSPRPTVTAKRKFPPRKRRLPSSEGSDGRPFGDANLWFGEVNARATGFGSAVHALFECLTWVGEITEGELEAKWSAALVGYEDFADEARAEVERSLDTPEIRALFERPSGSETDGAEVWMEKRFEMIVGEDQWVSGVFDRVNRFSDRAQIIDFKTNNVTNDEEIAKAVAHYRPQMETYRVALSRLTGLAPDKIDCLLIFTQPQRIVAIETGETEEAVWEDPDEENDSERVQGEFDL